MAVNVDERGAVTVTVTVTGLGSGNETVPGVVAAAQTMTAATEAQLEACSRRECAGYADGLVQ